MSTGRLIVGSDAPAQVGQSVRIPGFQDSKIPRFINFSGGQSGRSDLGLCLRLLGVFGFGFCVLAFGFCVLAFGFCVLAFGFWVLAFGFCVLAFGFCVSAFGFWVYRVGSG